MRSVIADRATQDAHMKVPGTFAPAILGPMLRPPSFAAVTALVLSIAALGCAGSEMRVSEPEPQRAPQGASLAERTQRTVAQLPDPTRAASDADAVSPPSAESETQSIPVPGSELVRGRTTVVVNAPIERVREAVLDFAHYPEFMPHYSKCKVLGRTPAGARDLYMEIAALHGAVKMWARVELPKPTIVDGTETYETSFVEGNVNDFKAIWRMSRIDEAHTKLSLEVFLHPKIPLPTDLLNEENTSGSKKGVTAMRARAEQTGK